MSVENVPTAPAIPSATVLLVRDRPAGMEVFLVKRHSGIDFAGGALVFPGGKTDPADLEPAMRSLCDGADHLTDGEIGNRVCGIRETFEEAGFLLAREKGTGSLVRRERADTLGNTYRQANHQGEISLGQMAERENLTLACDLMVPFAHWVTPSAFPKRFDTWFFLAQTPEDQLGSHDQEESVDSLWITPKDALEGATNKTFTLVFATRMNLRKVGEYNLATEALAAAESFEIVSIEPAITRTDEGVLFQIPPDAGYGLAEYLETDGSTKVPVK